MSQCSWLLFLCHDINEKFLTFRCNTILMVRFFLVAYQSKLSKLIKHFCISLRQKKLNCFSGHFFKDRCGRAGVCIFIFIQQKTEMGTFF